MTELVQEARARVTAFINSMPSSEGELQPVVLLLDAIGEDARWRELVTKKIMVRADTASYYHKQSVRNLWLLTAIAALGWGLFALVVSA